MKYSELKGLFAHFASAAEVLDRTASNKGISPNTIPYILAAQPITVNSNVTLTAEQCMGHIIYVTGNAQITLPDVSTCVEGSHLIIRVTSTATATVTPNANDRIVTLYGTVLNDGVSVVSSGLAGDQLVLHKDSDAGWTILGANGGWL